jgi:hypothetical protein
MKPIIAGLNKVSVLEICVSHVEPDRMFALSKVSYDWILYLDGDELLGRKLKNDIRWLNAKAEREHYATLSIVRIDYDTRCKQLVFGPCL